MMRAMGTTRADELNEVYARLSRTGLVRRLLEIARDEDVGERGEDVTSALFVHAGERLTADVVAREAGVVAGLATIGEMIEVFGLSVRASAMARDGERIERGQSVMRLEGLAREVLVLERTLLNMVGRLSGVASQTRKYVDAAGGGARVLDTRKTTPGLRVLEKYAVCCGGGAMHRLGLHDAVLIKDNHLAGVGLEDFAARLTTAAREARARERSEGWFFEVEVDGLGQFERVLEVEAGLIDVVLLDNFSVEQLREADAARRARRPGVLLEASGGVRLETIGAIAATGVDRISVGALTHSAVSVDFGLDAR